MQLLPQERRISDRIHFTAQANLFSDDDNWLTQLIDISLDGALVEPPSNWAGNLGDVYSLTFTHEGIPGPIRMGVSVARIDEEGVGLCCEDIGLDSLARLKFLIQSIEGSNQAYLNRDVKDLHR